MAQFTLTTTDTVPRSTALTGTITAGAGSITVEGSGTAFLTEINGGDWIYDAANGQIRKVDYVKTDTELILKSGFATAISGGSASITKGSTRQISIAASGGNIAITDQYDNASTILDGSSLTPEANRLHNVDPIIVAATSAASAYCSITE